MPPPPRQKKAPAFPSARILGAGCHIPEGVITNADLEKMVDTTDEWIVTRSGIRERRRAAPGQATSDLAVLAARQALATAGLEAACLDRIIVATSTPDNLFPSTACRVQHALGAPQVMSFDISAACSGFVYACELATQAITAGAARRVLVAGAETLTRFVDYGDRGTCILFGDGAGAVVMGPAGPEGGKGPPAGVLDIRCGADGADAGLITLPAGGSRQPASPETVAARRHFVHMDGRAVYREAIPRIVALATESMERSGLALEDIDLFIPHQMNQRIIESAAARLRLPMDRIFINLDRYGNTSTATIPTALAEAVAQGRLRPGQTALLVAFGAGLTWGVMALRW